MNSDNFVKTVMNPVRQRIIQYLIFHEKGTAGEMRKELSDIPAASLYRHLKTLLDAGCIEVLEAKKVRGTIENTYGLVQRPMGESPGQEEIACLIQASLMSLMSSFQQYFLKQDVDPAKDLLSLTTSTLMLTDEEFMELSGRLGQMMNDYVGNGPGNGRRPRRITFISSPCEDGY